MKKTLAILLSLALVICMIPATAATAWATATTVDTDWSVDNIAIDPIADQIYDGTNKPDVTVKATLTKEGESNKVIVLSKTDYTVAYSNNTNVGTATVTVTGSAKTSFADKTASASFNIKQLNLNDAIISTTSDILSSDLNNNNLNDSGKNKISIKVGSLDVKNASASSGGLKEKVETTYTYTAANGNTPASLTVVVSAKSGENANVTGSRQNTFSVKTDISSGYSIKLAQDTETFTYNGSAQEPRSGVIVYQTNSTQTILPSTAYNVSYTNNVKGGVKPTVTITGKDPYSGTFSAENVYYIQPKSITSSGISVSVGTGAAGYNPDVVVKDGNTLLTENTDYQLTFSGNAVTVKGIGNYTGETTKTFTLVGKTLTKAVVTSYATYYNGETQQANLAVTGSDGRTNLTKNVDYKVSYTYIDEKTGKSVTTESPSVAASYTVVVTGMGSYAGKITATNAFVVNPIPLDWTEIVQGSYTVYDSSSKSYVPKVTLRTKSGYPYGYSGYVTIPETDYNVNYRYVNYSSTYLKPTIAVSVATNAVNLTTTGSTKTEITAVFSNATRSLSSYCAAYFTNGKSSSAYTGYTITPAVTVRDGNTTLDSSQYTITYKNSLGKTVSSIKDAGTYAVVITGNGMYYGELTLTYTVTGNDISAYNVVLDKTSIDATGYSVTLPKVTKVYSGSTVLSASNYTVSYQNAAGTTITSAYAPGTYKVAVTGAGKYSGTAYATFTIVGKNQSITGVNSTYKVYPTTEAFKLTPKATEGAFTYTSSDNTVATVSSTGVVTPLKAGRAKITIKTTGNSKYNPAEYSTVIKVYPTKAVMTQKPWTTGKSKIKVRWNKQDNVTRYEIRYSRVKSFAEGTYLTKKVDAAQNDYTTQSTTIKNLRSGQKYYVKVRAVKEVYNDYGKKLTYYGAWSGWRSIRVQ